MTNQELQTQKLNTKLTPLSITCRIIAIIVGVFLLFSALAKTQPISSFISTIYAQFPLQFTYVTILAQFIVALEASLGIMLIMGLLGKKRWVLWVTNIIFIAFTIFVVYIWVKDGENADCGCLGDWVKLSPLETFIKNIILIGLTTFLLFKYKKEEGSSRHIFTYVILIILFFYTLLFYPAELDVNRLYSDDNNINVPTLTTGEKINLREGKYIFSLMSFSCSHCRVAAEKLSSIYEKDKSLPIIFVFNERFKDRNDIREDFFSRLPYKDIPTMFIPDTEFVYLAGKTVPSIYFIDNMIINKKLDDYNNATLESIQDWYHD